MAVEKSKFRFSMGVYSIEKEKSLIFEEIIKQNHQNKFVFNVL